MGWLPSVFYRLGLIEEETRNIWSRQISGVSDFADFTGNWTYSYITDFNGFNQNSTYENWLYGNWSYSNEFSGFEYDPISFKTGFKVSSSDQNL